MMTIFLKRKIFVSSSTETFRYIDIRDRSEWNSIRLTNHWIEEEDLSRQVFSSKTKRKRSFGFWKQTKSYRTTFFLQSNRKSINRYQKTTPRREMNYRNRRLIVVFFYQDWISSSFYQRRKTETLIYFLSKFQQNDRRWKIHFIQNVQQTRIYRYGILFRLFLFSNTEFIIESEEFDTKPFKRETKSKFSTMWLDD